MVIPRFTTLIVLIPFAISVLFWEDTKGTEDTVAFVKDSIAVERDIATALKNIATALEKEQPGTVASSKDELKNIVRALEKEQLDTVASSKDEHAAKTAVIGSNQSAPWQNATKESLIPVLQDGDITAESTEAPEVVIATLKTKSPEVSNVRVRFSDRNVTKSAKADKKLRQEKEAQQKKPIAGFQSSRSNKVEPLQDKDNSKEATKTPEAAVTKQEAKFPRKVRESDHNGTSTRTTVHYSWQREQNGTSTRTTAHYSWHANATESRLPEWMKDYLDWHVKERARYEKASPSKRKSFRFLVMICLQGQTCGGTADRLRSLLLWVLTAARSNRLLLIKWENPCPLEKFLIPNELNWTLPLGLPPLRKRAATIRSPFHWENALSSGRQVMQAKWQAEFLSKEWFSYNPGMTEAESKRIFHHLFRIMFQPSPKVAKMMQQQMEVNNLVPGKYIASHMRAWYPGAPIRNARAKPFEEQQAVMKREVTRVVKCASKLRTDSNTPIYFASDRDNVNEFVRREYNISQHNVYTMQGDNTKPVHIMNGKAGISSMYPIFVDLLIMGHASCVSFDRGGYGRFAMYMSYNGTSCYQSRLSSKCGSD